MTAKETKQERARQRRVEAGRAEAAEAARFGGRPTHAQLMLPMLDEIQSLGGRARPGELYDRLAERLEVPEPVLAETGVFNGRTHRLWERTVRWARQTAVLRGYLASPERGLWELTERGTSTLSRVRPGVVVTIFEDASGAALWAHAEDAAGLVERGSVNLVFVSPPYPIASGREYGRMRVPEWLEWMLRLCERWKELLAPDGSLMINVGQAYRRGAPVQSTHIERLTLELVDGLRMHLADRLYIPCAAVACKGDDAPGNKRIP